MNINRGKDFEAVVKDCFLTVPGVSIDRLHDQMTGFKGSTNICDFIVYKEPYEYYFECKAVHGNTLPFSNITENQWQGMLLKSKIPGVYAGVICWWVDRDVTIYIPIQRMQEYKEVGFKSIRFDIFDNAGVYQIHGKKKRVFFDYDMKDFLERLSYGKN